MVAYEFHYKNHSSFKIIDFLTAKWNYYALSIHNFGDNNNSLSSKC